MSGLLMRLGAQATGSGWAVRSDVRLPFGTLGPGPALAPAAAADTSPGSVAVDAGNQGLAPVAAAPRIAPRSACTSRIASRAALASDAAVSRAWL